MPEKIFSSLGDIIMLVFDMLVCIYLTKFKRDIKAVRILVHTCCTAIAVGYFVATFVFELPPAISSFLIISLPSFVLFFCISKYKDARFFVTFCLVDTISLIIAFFARVLSVYFGLVGAIIGCVLLLITTLTIYIKTSPYFPKYRALLESVKSGWTVTMISTLLIYLLLVIIASYPAPLFERKEYIPVYLAVSCTVISFYAVFISTLLQKKRLNELNESMKNQLDWHRIAFVDSLTGMNNRTAYIERINEIPRSFSENSKILVAMTDIDNFKQINDTFGHHVGDAVLIKAADAFCKAFCEKCYELFRIGGDEFAIIAVNVSREALEEKFSHLNIENEVHKCEFSYGISEVFPAENSAIENAFIRADAAMYRHKNSKLAFSSRNDCETK